MTEETKAQLRKMADQYDTLINESLEIIKEMSKLFDDGTVHYLAEDDEPSQLIKRVNAHIFRLTAPYRISEY